MPDRQKASGLYGHESPNSLYCQGTGTGDCGNGEVPGTTSEDQQFFNDSNWPFQDTPPYDYDVASFYQQGWNMNNLNQQVALQDGLSPRQSMPLPPQSMNEFGPSAYAMTTPVASPIVSQARPMAPEAPVNFLTDDQRQKLQNIAMPTTIPYHSPRSEPSPDSAGGAGKLSTSSSPAGIRDFDKPVNRKRKSSTEENDDDDDDDDEIHHPVKKTAHNMIEKRYRTNLNDKIAALRDSVPSLRIMTKSARGEDTTIDREELQGLTPAHKLNKATVLSKATEYIRHLEKRNSRLLDENTAMQQRIAAFEKLFMSGAMNNVMSSHQQHAPPTPSTYPLESTIFAPSPMGTPSRPDPQGMIQVPDDMKRIIDAQRAAGQPYPVAPQPTFRPNPALVRQQQIQQQAQMQARGWSNATPYFGKLMVGSLAGLMLLEAISENEKSNESPEGRGLFAIPIQILEFLTANLNIHFVGYSIQAANVIYSIKLTLLLCSIWWALMPSLTSSQPHSMKQSKQIHAAPKAAPSLASPIHVRRQAWLTAVQTVWVPRRHILLEASALCLKAVKLSLRNLIGVHGYQILTGLTQEEEIARVKAWEIALDAQLAGGDIEISKRRLTLTFLASSTLPTTPARLMLKALHIRVLLWDCGPTGMRTALQVIAAKYARTHWNQAKQLYRITSQLRRNGQEFPDDDLPDHLAALLEQECDDVLNPSIIQRAYNLAWNRPTEHNEIARVDGMATVTEDPAVRSPMDAVAAWWSSMVLQGALTTSLLVEEDEQNSPSLPVESDVTLAIRTAPIGSVAQQRALVARALLSNEKRGFNIVAALHAIGPVTPILATGTDSRVNNFTIPLPPVKELASQMATELRTSLLCAMVIAHLQKYSPPDEPVHIYGVINQIQPACDMGLLGYTAAYKLMDHLARHELAAEACDNTLERFSGSLRIWTGKGAALEPEIRHHIVKRCISVTKGITGMDFGTGMNFDTDTGYGSMSDAESDYGDFSAPEPEPEPQQPSRTTIETAEPPSCGCS